MPRIRCLMFCLALLVAGMVVVGSPGVAAAAPNDAPRAYQGDSGGPSDRNLISVPGVFTLRLGQSASTRDGAIRLDGTQVELPGINATATLDGFSFSPRDGSFSWDGITVMQSQPAGNESFTLSNTRATVQGRETNFSTQVSTRIDVRPNEASQAGATLTLNLDRLTGQTSLAVADGNAQVAVGPATVTVQGMDTTSGALTIDTAQVMLPEAETGVRVDGFTLANGSASWEALAWYGREFNLGNAVTLSDNLVVVPGSAAGDTRAGGATTTFTVNVGELGQTGGQLVLMTDPATGQPALMLRNGSATLGAAGWSVAASGINVGPSGAAVDTVTLIVEPLGVQAQVTGLEATAGAGASFDQTRILYLPPQNGASRTVGGFELVISSTQAGYVVTTTTLLPTAQAGQ